MKSSIDRIAIERYQDYYRDCSKTVFQRREKHRYEFNQASYSTKDPNNILSSQKHHSLKNNVKHLDPKHTHTHTKQV